MRPVDNTRAALDQAYEHALDWPDGSRSATRMPGLVAPAGSFFGFVIGGTVPAALAADRLTAVWDQNAPLRCSPRPRGPLRPWPLDGNSTCSRCHPPPLWAL